MDDVRKQLEGCLAKFRSGTLSDGDLTSAIESAGPGGHARPACQRLLYLQAESTLITSRVEGMSIVDGHGVHPGPDDPSDWPYQTVHEAVLDGWRVVKFPELALMMAPDDRTYGIGCEFILEK